MKQRYMPHLDKDKPDLPPPSTWLGVAARIWDFGWPRFRRWLEHRKPQNRIYLRLDKIDIYIDSVDRGRADFRIDVINFSRKKLQIDYMEIRFWKIGNYGLRDQSNLTAASGVIENTSVGTGYFSISLTASDIKQIITGIDPVPHAKLIPRAIFELHGKAICNFEGSPIRVGFSFNHQCESINIPLNIIEQI